MTCFVCIESVVCSKSACVCVDVLFCHVDSQNCNLWKARSALHSCYVEQCKIGSGCHSVGPLGVIVISMLLFFLILPLSPCGDMLCYYRTRTLCKRHIRKPMDFPSSCCFLCNRVRARSLSRIHAVTHNLHLILIEIFFALTKEMWTACFSSLSFSFSLTRCYLRAFLLPDEMLTAMTHSQHLNKLLLHAFFALSSKSFINKTLSSFNTKQQKNNNRK